MQPLLIGGYMKKCNICSIEKPLTEFYKGYAKCKSCRYMQTVLYRKTDAGIAARKKEAVNARASGKKKIRQERYKLTEKGKLCRKKYDESRFSTEKGKARLAAKNAVRYAIKAGKLIKEPCWICGDLNTVAHHPSYAEDMRLVVSWLCVNHHNEIHNIPNEV
jgi:hypothetical protein